MGTLSGCSLGASNISLCSRPKGIGIFKERVRIMATSNHLSSTCFMCKHKIFDTYKFFPQRGFLVFDRFKFFSSSSNNSGNDDDEDTNSSKDSNFATEELEIKSEEEKSSVSISSGVSDVFFFSVTCISFCLLA